MNVDINCDLLHLYYFQLLNVEFTVLFLLYYIHREGIFVGHKSFVCLRNTHTSMFIEQKNK